MVKFDLGSICLFSHIEMSNPGIKAIPKQNVKGWQRSESRLVDPKFGLTNPTEDVYKVSQTASHRLSLHAANIKDKRVLQ